MKRRVLVETRPAGRHPSSVDEHHAACVKALHQLPGPLLSCWPVITEAVWLLRLHPRAVQQLLRSVSEKPGGFLELLPLAGTEANSIADVMKKYEDARPQLADAALVYLADREGIDTIFTLDRRDFAVYRSNRNHAFRLVHSPAARPPSAFSHQLHPYLCGKLPGCLLLTNLGSASSLRSGGFGRCAIWWRRCGPTSNASMETPGWKARSRIFGRRIPGIFISL